MLRRAVDGNDKEWGMSAFSVVERKQFSGLLYFDETWCASGASCVKIVAPLKGETEGAFRNFKVQCGELNGERRAGGCRRGSWLLRAVEIFSELCGDEATVFDVFDSCLEQDDVQVLISQSPDDIFKVRFGSCFSKDVEGDCKRSKLHFGSALLPCRYGGKGRRCCSEMKIGIVLCGSGSR